MTTPIARPVPRTVAARRNQIGKVLKDAGIDPSWGTNRPDPHRPGDYFQAVYVVAAQAEDAKKALTGLWDGIEINVQHMAVLIYVPATATK